MNHLGNPFVSVFVWLLLNLRGSAREPSPCPISRHLVAPETMNGRGRRQRHVNLIGDPSAGPYIRLAKWLPGNIRRPHYHSTTRYFYIASGTCGWFRRHL